VRGLKIGSCHVPYWLGQTWVAARVPIGNIRSTVSSALLSLQLLLSAWDLLTVSGA
jgi:hypothetical protein